MIARNKYTHHRLQSRAEKAWSDYSSALSSMLPLSEVQKLTNAAARELHFARWARIEAAEARWTGRTRAPKEDEIE